MNIDPLVQVSVPVVAAETGIQAVEERLLRDGFLCIFDQEVYCGILTPADVIAKQHSLVVDCLRETPIVLVGQGIDDVLKLMQVHNLSTLPVFSGREFFGVITKSKIIEFLSSHYEGLEIQLSEKTKKIIEMDTVQQQQGDLARNVSLQTMGEMTSSIAHELNQPLAAIVNYARGCTRRLYSGSWDAQELIAVIEQIVEQAERANNVVRSIRDFVSKKQSKKRVADLHSLIVKTLKLVDAVLRQNKVTVHYQNDNWSCLVWVDEIQIQQVILNLIHNSVEAMSLVKGRERVICLSTAVIAGEMLEMTVTDTGLGVDLDTLEQVFKPFFTTKDQGMGLGLSISRSIIENHGGRLWLKNHDDVGCTFGFTLPIAKGHNGDQSH